MRPARLLKPESVTNIVNEQKTNYLYPIEIIRLKISPLLNVIWCICVRFMDDNG
jgi:hypothetical protein